MARKKPDTPASTGAPAAEPTQEQAAAGSLRITSAREGFRRAGRAWSATPTEVPLADLTAEQVAMLMAEPMLTVVDVRPEPVEGQSS